MAAVTRESVKSTTGFHVFAQHVVNWVAKKQPPTVQLYKYAANYGSAQSGTPEETKKQYMKLPRMRGQAQICVRAIFH